MKKILLSLFHFCGIMLLGLPLIHAQTTITTLGSNSLTVPAGSTYALIECLGGGGAGGGASGVSGTTIGYAGGGGGGAYSRVTIAVTPGQILTAFVGAGGASAGLNPFDGAPGQASYTSYNGATVCRANGGLGGQGVTQTNGLGGTGGNSGIGFLFAGGNGGTGNIAGNRGGGGGGGAGSTSAGGNGAAPAGGTPGTGGFGSGTGGGGANTFTGAAGTNFGAGGGGGGTGAGASNGAGGSGAQGKIVITFCTTNITAHPATTGQNLCVGAAATALSVTAGAGPFLWFSNTTASNTGGTSTGITTSSFTPPTGAAGTTYYYCVVGTAACAVPSDVSGPIAVGGAITVTGSTLICGTGSVTLNATSPGATAYLWAPGGQTTSAITVSPTSTTTYTCTTSGGACPGANSRTITVSPPITFSATATSDNLNGYSGFSGDVLYLNAYPIQNNVFINGLNNSYTGSLGGAWTPSTANAGSTCGGQNAALSFVTSTTMLGTGLSITPQEGSHMLYFNSGFTDAGGQGFVTSPTFSTVGLTGLIVDFWFMQFVNSNGGEYIAVEYRVGAGAWTAMTANIPRVGNSTQCPSWMNFSQEFPAAMIGQPAVQVRFRFFSGGCFGQQMLLDNIRISSITAPGGYSYYSNYLWTETATGASATIINPLIRSTTTGDVNQQSAQGSIVFNVRLTDNAGCVYNASDVVNINPDVSGGNIGAATANPTVICSTPGSTALSTVSGTGPNTIQWQQSTVGAAGPWTDIPGATTLNFTATGITQTTWYRIRPATDFASISGACEGSISTTPVMVTIESITSGTVQAPGVTICEGADPATFGMSVLPTLVGLSNYTYQWYSSNGDVAAPTGSTIPVGWTAIGSPTSSATPFVSLDNFDAANGWTVGGNFAVGPPVSGNTVTTAFSGANVLGTVLNGNYLANCTEAANFAISPTIDLTGIQNPVLKYHTNSRWGSGDNGKTFVSINNGASYSAALETVSTSDAGWVQRTVSIPTAANQSQVRIKFTMVSNGFGQASGWNIDNVTIEGSTPNPPTNDPPVTTVGSPTTTYALFITTTGVCPLNTWALSEYTVTVEPCALPIELKSFSGTCNHREKTFNWVTATEQNNAYFTLEKSRDGAEFQSVQIIAGAGNSSIDEYYTIKYTEYDESYLYYRLKQTDNDGTSAYSEVIHTACASGYESILVFPNPAEEIINIDLSEVSYKGDIVISITDILGRNIGQQTVSTIDQRQAVLDIEYLENGNYILVMREGTTGKRIGSAIFTKNY